MTTFMVIEKRADGQWNGLGEHTFRAVPRVGEHIEMNDPHGIGQVYEVLTIIHPLNAAGNAGDIIIRHIATTTDFHTRL